MQRRIDVKFCMASSLEEEGGGKCAGFLGHDGASTAVAESNLQEPCSYDVQIYLGFLDPSLYQAAFTSAFW